MKSSIGGLAQKWPITLTWGTQCCVVRGRKEGRLGVYRRNVPYEFALTVSR